MCIILLVPGVPWRESAILGRIPFRSREHTLGKEHRWRGRRNVFFALCLANTCPSLRYRIARSTSIDREWLFFVTGRQGMCVGKGLWVDPWLCCISDSFLVPCVLSHPYSLSWTESGRGPHLTRSERHQEILDPPSRSEDTTSREHLCSGAQRYSQGALFWWSHLSKALSQFPICNMKRNNV